jgi:hypothetical protein
MTQDEIIEMARQAGLTVTYIGDPIGLSYAQIAHFAKLVAAKEREACAKVCEEIYTGEEEWCGYCPSPKMCASEIRARGEPTSRGEA